jgi:YgiT-type zinc finger domain-containing protein
MAAKVMRTAIWQGDRVAIVEDVPALVCGKCNEQYYDESVSDALRRLAEDGFPAEAAISEAVVPVFSLRERIRKPQQVPEDAYVD